MNRIEYSNSYLKTILFNPDRAKSGKTQDSKRSDSIADKIWYFEELMS
jgi:hypothetical protein